MPNCICYRSLWKVASCPRWSAHLDKSVCAFLYVRARVRVPCVSVGVVTIVHVHVLYVRVRVCPVAMCCVSCGRRTCCKQAFHRTPNSSRKSQENRAPSHAEAQRARLFGRLSSGRPARWALPLPLARADGPHAFEIVRAEEGVRLLL